VEWILACFPLVDRDTLIKRCNYQAYIWLNAHQSALLLLPRPQGLGWEVNDVGALEIKWTEGELMPQELADIIVVTLAGDDEGDKEFPELENVVDLIF